MTMNGIDLELNIPKYFKINKNSHEIKNVKYKKKILVINYIYYLYIFFFLNICVFK